MPSIVVTGATGHLGRLIVEALLRDGVSPSDITAGGRAVEKLDDFAERGVKVAKIDYSEPATLSAAFAGNDVLVLVSGSEAGQRVPQHKAAIDTAVAAGITRIIYTSAPHADTSALILAPEHKATEEMLAAAGIPTTVLRNNWYTENYVAAANQARETGEIVASVGDGRVASATRADYADAAAVVALDDSHAGKVYELSGDVAWTFDDLAAAVSEVTGVAVEYRRVSGDELVGILTSSGLDEGTAHFVVGLEANIRDGVLSETSGDLARLIGRPTTPLVDGLRAALAE
jgi:NAD(P)H dehydrogenase (quinone)